MDPAGTGYQNLAGNDFPRDVIVIDTISRLVNETFEKAIVEDGIYNHHTVFMDASIKPQSWLSCNGKEVPEMPMAFFMGSGSEDIDSKYASGGDRTVKAGFYIGKNDVITFGVDIVNYHNRERELYTINEMEYLPGKPEGYVHSQNRIISMGICDGANAYMTAANIHPPKDKKKFVLSGKNDITINRDGYMMSICKSLTSSKSSNR
jgi:hypothetical protein